MLTVLNPLLLASAALFSAVAATPVDVTPRDTYGPTREIFFRVEGPNATIFEKTIHASGGYITTASGGAFLCDGDSVDGDGPTPLTALEVSGLSFDTTKPDQYVTELDGISNGWDGLWGYALERVEAAGGPCEHVLEASGHAEFVWISNPIYGVGDLVFLLLNGPTGVKVDESATYTVTANYGTGAPGPEYAINGCNVNTKLSDVDGNDGAEYYGITGSNGVTEITFKKAGTYNLKAHAPENIDFHPVIRSQHLLITVTD